MTVSLNAALSGLKAAQKSLDVISNNIANATTVGYTRKILPQEALLIDGTAVGVQVGAITRTVDKILMRDLITQISVSEKQAVTQKYLDRIQDFNGASEANQSLAASVSDLAKSFTDLSSAPDNLLSLSKTLTAAQQTASKFNNFSNLLTQMRRETEGEIASNLGEVNSALTRIADLNTRINNLTVTGQSAAELEDQRDMAMRTVAKYVQISSYPSDNGKLVVTTRTGQVLADEQARQLVFQAGNVLPTSYYPGGGLSGIYIDSTSGTALSSSDIGGAVGGLIDLRDRTLPTYQAQIDELAQKLAFRLDQQGLKLFTDQNGNVPPDTAGAYVGFSATMRVNNDIVNDSSLLRRGTNGNAVLAGSNEVIRKVSQFAFGAYAYQEARGTQDITPGPDLFTTLGLSQTNRVTGTTDISSLGALTSNPDIVAGSQFQLNIPGGAGAPWTFTIGAADTAIDLVNNINAAAPGTASLNGLGQLVLNANADITLTDVSIGATGMAALGFSFGTTAAKDPSFTVRVGAQPPVTITISAGDTAASLLNDLNLIPGLTATTGTGGELVLTPTEGGDITLTDGTGAPLSAMGVAVTNIAHTPLRQTGLGPDGTISTGLLANSTIESYARSIISAQATEAQTTQNNAEKEDSFLQMLEKRNADSSGVDIDQELSQMIRIQSQYSAAARIISSEEKMLDALLSSV